MTQITVIGCGHVGLVLAAGLTKLGHNVVGLDRRETHVARLNDGRIDLHEPGLADLVREGLTSGKLGFTTEYATAIPWAEVIFLAVDTPATPTGAADLTSIRSAVKSIAAALDGGSPIVVNKSTSPIGTGETIEDILVHALADRAFVPRIVSNPEFLRQGHVVADFFAPDRIVVGARRREDAEFVAALYGNLDAPVLVTDLRTAEMIKYVSNSFLATRVSFVNEIARLCQGIGIDVDDVIAGVVLDPRMGRGYLTPGIGFGGSCLPKDIAALRYVGDVVGVATPLLTAVQTVNQGQRIDAVRRMRERLGGLERRMIGVWGVTFKGGTEDMRESPALDVVRLLRNDGASVKVYDPMLALGAPAELVSVTARTAYDAADGADLVAVLANWEEFRAVDLGSVRRVMRGVSIFDGCDLLNRADVEAAGLDYIGVGRTASTRVAVPAGAR